MQELKPSIHHCCWIYSGISSQIWGMPNSSLCLHFLARPQSGHAKIEPLPGRCRLLFLGLRLRLRQWMWAKFWLHDWPILEKSSRFQKKFEIQDCRGKFWHWPWWCVLVCLSSWLGARHITPGMPLERLGARSRARLKIELFVCRSFGGIRPFKYGRDVLTNIKNLRGVFVAAVEIHCKASPPSSTLHLQPRHCVAIMGFSWWLCVRFQAKEHKRN